MLDIIKHRLFKFELIYVGWLIVVISLVAYAFSVNAENFLLFVPKSSGIGASADYLVELYISQISPLLYLYIFGVFLPGAKFFLSYKISRHFLNSNLSTLIALLSFSSIDGYPFHSFILNVFHGSMVTLETNFIRGVDLSTILALSSLSIILSAKYLYINQSWLAVFLVILTIFFDSLDGFAVSVIFALHALLKGKAIKTNLARKISVIIIISLSWVLNFTMFTDSAIITSDLANLKIYLLLYIILPPILFITAIYTFKVDLYQILTRFSGIVLVFFSECIILISHYLGIFEVLLSELQYDSVFSFFHILYFVPILSWRVNSNHYAIAFPIAKILRGFWSNLYIKRFVILMFIIFILIYNLLLSFNF